MKLKKMLALILAMAMVLSMAACGSSGGNESEAPGQQQEQTNAPSNNNPDTPAPPADGYQGENINVAIQSDGGTMDPFASFVNWGQAAMTGLIYEALISLDFDYNIYYQLAKSIEQVDDTHWNVEIWDCIYDTAGNQLTIDDVIWCYQKFIDGGNIGGIPKFSGWERTGDFTGTMVLSEKFGAGDFEKHFGNVKILCQKTYEEVAGGDMTTNPIGSGCYKMKDYNVGSQVVLEANEDYWAKDLDIDNPFTAQNFKTITYSIIQDASARAIALKSGSVDVCDAMDAVDLDNLDDSFNRLQLPVRAPVAIVLNCNEQSVMSSLELRQGILYGLNNEDLAAGLPAPSKLCYGLQPLMVDTPDSWVNGREYYDYDPQKAAELIASSGYNGETIELLYIAGDSVYDTAAIAIQAQLSELGVKVELKGVDQTTANEYQYLPEQFDIRLATLGGGAYMSQTTKGWWSKDGAQHYPEGSNWNFSLVADAKLDELYEALKADPNDTTIGAWADYFDSMAYGYSFCSYSNQTACAGNLDATVVGNSGMAVVPNAMVVVG